MVTVSPTPEPETLRRVVELASRAPSVAQHPALALAERPQRGSSCTWTGPPAADRGPVGAQRGDQLRRRPAPLPGGGGCPRLGVRGAPGPRPLRLVPARPSRPGAGTAVPERRDRPERHRRALHRPPPVHLLAGARRAAPPPRRTSRRHRAPGRCPLLGVSERFRAELLVSRAIDIQHADRGSSCEQQAWIDHGAARRRPVRRAAPSPARSGTAGPAGSRAGLVDDMGGRESRRPTASSSCAAGPTTPRPG